MSPALTERLINRMATSWRRAAPATTRRGFLGGAALVGAALTVDPWGYLTRPASAYDTVCGADNTCGAGYTVFCCTINGGKNSCPPDSFIGGWWKADHSSFCGGSARYYIDCNAYRDGRYTCHCNQTTCDQRRVACNQFRYGQCNTQISWANTGPVLCRLVSCTPPWVQFGGTCSSSSATDNNTVTHSAPCLTGRPPVGVVDSVTTNGNSVRVSGWTYDADQPGSSIRVVLYEDGKPLTVYTANLSRPDVNRALNISGNHGFSIPLTATNGRHEFKVYALNIAGGSGNSLLGTRSVVVNPGSPPTGVLDSAVVSGSIVTLTGWAYDRDSPGSPLRVVVYQDGKPLTVVQTTVSRPDVNAAFGITGTHGYRVRLTASNGSHSYRVYAMNIGGGTGNPLIGSRTVTVPGASAVTAGPLGAQSVGTVASAGQVESVSASGNSVRLTGWAHDPDRPGEQIAVAVLEDGASMHWYGAGLARPDINAVHGLTGNHGFDITLTAGDGGHSYTVYALTVVDGAELPSIGSRSVAVNHAGPVGQVDSVTNLGTTVRIIGWTYDPQQPSAELGLVVHVDGAVLSTHTSGLGRADVNRSYGIEGAHGFDISLRTDPGRHSFTVYALDAADVGKPALIGGATLEIADSRASLGSEVST